MKRMIVLAAVILAAMIGPAHGEFVDGIESFDGTDLDTVTWEAYTDGPDSYILQDDELIIGNNHQGSGVPRCDYTTLNITVGVGEGVRAKVSSSAGSTVFRNARLCLTDNIAGTKNSLEYDDNGLWLEWIMSPDSESRFFGHPWSGQTGGSGIIFYNQEETTQDFTYYLQIEWPAIDRAIFSVFDAEMNPLGSYDRSNIYQTLPSQLYVSLYFESIGEARFDDVTIIPEPGMLFLIGLGGLTLLRRRTRV
ncbi:MAG: PEP-CTERM sorting domain-containing protein [Phycisphaerae bacterium]|nr:PEP-CTERM sorting domain-containing protein [Phycisphaerae bacterium]